MLLKDENALIFGAGGNVGSAVSKQMPTVAETAAAVTLLASDRATPLNGTIVNSPFGEVVG